MKLIKTAKNKFKLKLSSFEWRTIGKVKGWLSSVLANIKNEQKIFEKSLIRFAAINEINEDDIQNVVRNSLDIDYGRAFVLRENDAVIMDNGKVNDAFVTAFVQLINKNKELNQKVKLYIAHNKPFQLGAYLSSERNNRYLIPSFDGMGISQLKVEFTALLPFDVTLPTVGHQVPTETEMILKEANDLEGLIEMMNAAGFITGRGKMAIGTIGSRSTNWDTSYNLHIDGVSVSILQKVLTWFTDISNENMHNLTPTERGNSFDLTQRKEVESLMNRMGLGKEFYQVVNRIKDFEDEKGLKRKYQKEKRIPDYKEKTQILTLDLKEKQTQILRSLTRKILSVPTYVNILNARGVQDPQEFLSLAFDEGLEGNIINTQEISALINIAI